MNAFISIGCCTVYAVRGCAVVGICIGYVSFWSINVCVIGTNPDKPGPPVGVIADTEFIDVCNCNDGDYLLYYYFYLISLLFSSSMGAIGVTYLLLTFLIKDDILS